MFPMSEIFKPKTARFYDCTIPSNGNTLSALCIILYTFPQKSASYMFFIFGNSTRKYSSTSLNNVAAQQLADSVLWFLFHKIHMFSRFMWSTHCIHCALLKSKLQTVLQTMTRISHSHGGSNKSNAQMFKDEYTSVLTWWHTESTGLQSTVQLLWLILSTNNIIQLMPDILEKTSLDESP